MPTIAMSGNDTLTINNRVIVDAATDDWAELTYSDDIANLKTGKNGNSIYGLNETGKQAELKLKVLRGSSDDIFLNGLLSQQQLSFETFPLMTAELIKKLGDGAGAVKNDTYVLSGGVFSRQVDAKSNVSGDTDQSTSMYTFKFANSPRAIT